MARQATKPCQHCKEFCSANPCAGKINDRERSKQGNLKRRNKRANPEVVPGPENPQVPKKRRRKADVHNRDNQITNVHNRRSKNRSENITIDSLKEDMRQWKSLDFKEMQQQSTSLLQNYAKTSKVVEETVFAMFVETIIALYYQGLKGNQFAKDHGVKYNNEDYIKSVLSKLGGGVELDKITKDFTTDVKSAITYIALIDAGYTLKQLPVKSIANIIGAKTGRTLGDDPDNIKWFVKSTNEPFTAAMIPDLYQTLCDKFNGKPPAARPLKEYFKEYLRNGTPNESIAEQIKKKRNECEKTAGLLSKSQQDVKKHTLELRCLEAELDRLEEEKSNEREQQRNRDANKDRRNRDAREALLERAYRMYALAKHRGNEVERLQAQRRLEKYMEEHNISYHDIDDYIDRTGQTPYL